MKRDRQLTYRQHLEDLRSKISARNNLLRCLAGTSWGAKTSTLRTSALAVVYSAAEYSAPAWCRSKHTKKLDVVLNNTMRIITGCLKPTPIEYLPVLAGIPPLYLRREELVHKFVNKVIAAEHHPLYSRILNCSLPRQRLSSRQPFIRYAKSLVGSEQFNILDEWNNVDRSTAHSRLANFGMSPASSLPPGSVLPRKAWTVLNRLRSGVGCLFITDASNSCLSRWGLKSSPSCSCGTSEQTADNIIVCPLNPSPHGKRGLTHLDEPTRRWLKELPSF